MVYHILSYQAELRLVALKPWRVFFTNVRLRTLYTSRRLERRKLINQLLLIQHFRVRLYWYWNSAQAGIKGAVFIEENNDWEFVSYSTQPSVLNWAQVRKRTAVDLSEPRTATSFGCLRSCHWCWNPCVLFCVSVQTYPVKLQERYSCTKQLNIYFFFKRIYT